MRIADLAFLITVGFSAVSLGDAQDFATAKPGRVFAFPRDHGSHPEFRTEWWYVTGHLHDEAGKRFGFQATFFRQAQLDEGKPMQMHLAHAAWLDVAAQKFISEEKLNREGWDAMASTSKLAVRNGNWSLSMGDDDETMKLAFTVNASVVAELEMKPEKLLVIFGKDGVSRKGASPEAASHYLTYPRLKVSGKARTGDISQTMSGEAWMDHEFSSSQLDAGQLGWDWAAIQLNDGREVMVYRMRREDGSIDASSTLAIVDPSGKAQHHPADGFSWEVLDRWKSPVTGAAYPNHVCVTVAADSFELRPLAQDQELDGSITGLPYWEGACDVLDLKGNLIGKAFLELAGYAGNLRQHLAK